MASLKKLATLSDQDENRFLKVKKEIQKKQFLAARALIQSFIPRSTLSYLSSGKPILDSSNFHISITHSDHFAAIVISKNRCGVDLQKKDEKVVRIKSKYLNEKELKLINKEIEVDECTILWAAKEAAYKMAGIKGLAFKEIHIERRNNIDFFKGKINNNNTSIHLNFSLKQFDDFVLVDVIE